MQKVLEEKIAFADQREATALLGEHDEYLQVLMDNFDCRFISRGEELAIDGEATVVRAAAQVVRELQYLHRQGTTLTMHEVRYSVGLVKRGKGEALHSLFSDTILVTSRGRHVRPKTLGQRIYLDAIRKNSITFGIGPAGTGKTYLAVVMAVAALRARLVEKIVLTRPAVEASGWAFCPAICRRRSIRTCARSTMRCTTSSALTPTRSSSPRASLRLRRSPTCADARWRTPS